MPQVISSYDSELGAAKTVLALHRVKRSGLLRLRRCEWCKERWGRDGCDARQATLAVFAKRADAAERRASVSSGYLFTPTEEHAIPPADIQDRQLGNAVQGQRHSRRRPTDSEAVIV